MTINVKYHKIKKTKEGKWWKMNIWHDINGERIKKDKFVSVIEIQKNGKLWWVPHYNK